MGYSHLGFELSLKPGLAQPSLAMRPEPAPSQAGSCAGHRSQPGVFWALRRKGRVPTRCHVIVQVPWSASPARTQTKRSGGRHNLWQPSCFLHKEVSATSARCHFLSLPYTADHSSLPGDDTGDARRDTQTIWIWILLPTLGWMNNCLSFPVQNSGLISRSG